MKYFVILLLSLSLVSSMIFEFVYGESYDFRFVELNDSYFLGDKITIKFEKITQQPCPSYEISIMKAGFPESMINVGVEPLCAIPGPVEAYLFSGDMEKREFFDSAGTYIIKVKLDNETIQKEIKITDNKGGLKEFDGFFTINEKQVRYVIPYTISNGIIDDMTLYCEHGSLSVKITPQAESDGMLVLDFPRSVIDPKTNDKDGRFFVLRDGEEIGYDEIPYSKYRKISIPFVADTQEIEIIQAFIPEFKPEMCKITHEPPYSYIIPPLKQFKSGVVADEIQCRELLVLMSKHDGTPACVKEQTVPNLIERGWAIPLTIVEERNPKDILSFDSDAASAIDANNEFALNFYSQINGSSENIFFSPWSISTAFAILQEGARGNTSEQIREVFGFSAYSSQRQSGFKTINENLNASDDRYLLSIANSLWLAHGFSPYPEFVAVAKNNYESYVQEIDFQKDGVNIINAWVDEKTKKKIPELFVPGSLDSAVFAIANAIYFKGTWDNQFDPEKTQNAEFWRTNDSAVQVPMMYMHQSKQQIAFLDEVQLLELPYDGDKLSMLVLLPDEIDGLDKLESVISVEKIKEWKKELREQSAVVIMPKFKLEADYKLIPELQSMGISDLFGPSSDLGGMSDLPLFVGEAVHKAVIEVNEEGTEAAAATGIGGFMSGPPSFAANHPFIFIIQDSETGNILFMGRVTDPTK